MVELSAVPSSRGGALKPLYVTVPVALSITSLGRTKFYQLIEAGKIKTIQIGRKRLVVYASLETLAQGMPDDDLARIAAGDHRITAADLSDDDLVRIVARGRGIDEPPQPDPQRGGV